MQNIEHKVVFWVERYLYHPTFLDKILSFLLLPLSLFYTLIVVFKRSTCRAKDLGVAVVSVGNLTLGGSGKTPLTIALASRYKKSAVVLRGYKRDSKGLHVVSLFGELKCDIKTAGDEAFEYAKSLASSCVIVSEDRVKGVQKAKELGCEVVFLDDGFNKAHIKKFDILIHQNFSNHFCIPSGPYKEPIWLYKKCDFLATEGVDFAREVTIENKTSNMVLVTAIANPKRLDKFLPSHVEKFYFKDHHNFTKDEVVEILTKTKATSLLTTNKDFVKLESFGLPISLLKLSLHVEDRLLRKVDDFIMSCK